LSNLSAIGVDALVILIFRGALAEGILAGTMILSFLKLIIPFGFTTIPLIIALLGYSRGC